MNVEETYKNIFEQKSNYNVHVSDKDRYDFVINEILLNNHKKIIDISSGRGFLLKYLLDKTKDIDITSTDLFKFNDINVKFIQLNLCKNDDYKKIVEKYELLSCLDVLEHVEEKYIEDIFLFFKKISNKFCFSIANHSDIENGVELHLIRKNKEWWDDILNKHFIIKKSFVKYNNRLYCYILEIR